MEPFAAEKGLPRILRGSPQFVEKALLFHKLCAYFKWKRGLAPFSKPFSPCSLDSF